MELFEIGKTLGGCLETGFLPVNGFAEKLLGADLLRSLWRISDYYYRFEGVSTWSLIFDPRRAA